MVAVDLWAAVLELGAVAVPWPLGVTAVLGWHLKMVPQLYLFAHWILRLAQLHWRVVLSPRTEFRSSAHCLKLYSTMVELASAAVELTKQSLADLERVSTRGVDDQGQL